MADERRFPRPEKQSILGRVSWSVVGEFDRPLTEPADGRRVVSESGLAEDRVMAATVEGNDEAVGLDRHGAGGLDEPPEELFRVGFLEALQSRRQPAVAAVGDHGQGGVEVDIETHLAGEAVEVEEVHADAQAALDPVAAGVADDRLAWGLLEVVGEEQCGAIAAQAGHGELADWALVAAQSHGFFDVTDMRMTSFGDVDHGPLPGGSGLLFQVPEDGRSASADGDEMDLALVDARQFGVVDD